MPGGEKLVGIRHQVHDEPDPEWLLHDDVQRGVARVGEAGLVFDLLVRARAARSRRGRRARRDVRRRPPGEADLERRRQGVGHLDGAYRRLLERRGQAVGARHGGRLGKVDAGRARTVRRTRARMVRSRESPVRLGLARVTLAASYEEVFGAYRSLVEDLAPRNIEDMLGANAARVTDWPPERRQPRGSKPGEAWVRHRRGRCDREGGEAQVLLRRSSARRSALRFARSGNVDRVAELASEHDVELTALAYYGLASFEPPSEEELERTYEHVFAAAETLGVTVVASMSGVRLVARLGAEPRSLCTALSSARLARVRSRTSAGA